MKRGVTKRDSRRRTCGHVVATKCVVVVVVGGGVDACACGVTGQAVDIVNSIIGVAQ